jgi:multicomponent Na+:H+ antiporter subunit D
MVVGIGVAQPLAVAAATFFALHHSLVKSSLYLVADELERRNGARDLRQMDFRRSGAWPLAVCFGVGAFSLVGIPPSSGFFGKLGVFRAAVDGELWLGLALLAGASVLTLASMLKIWRFAFQRTPVGDGDEKADRPALPALVALSSLIIGLALAAGPAFEYSREAAVQLLDGRDYAEAVLGSGASGLPEPAHASELRAPTDEGAG